MNVAIIPARGGSKRIPMKNCRLFHGKPIIAYSIETARASGLFDKIIVSTEDEHVRAVAKAYGAKIHNRARSLADDVTGTQEVMKAALQWWLSSPNTTAPEFACCIYATAPMMTVNDLRRCYYDVVEQHFRYSYIEGWCYAGLAKDFMNGTPLTGKDVMRIEVPERWVDINTEEDWQRAERMYQELKEAEREHAI